MTDQPTPLSAEPYDDGQLRTLRAFVETNAPESQWTHDIVARLLATIDATRASAGAAGHEPGIGWHRHGPVAGHSILAGAQAWHHHPRSTPAHGATTDGGLDVDLLARALHGTGTDLAAEPWTWGSCMNWAPGWGDECGPDRHMDEARTLLRRLAAARLPAEP